jgi:hypothetical protein
VYKVGTESVILAKDLFNKYEYNENNNRFEVYYNGNNMQDAFNNDQVLKSAVANKDYIYAGSKDGGFYVISRSNPKKCSIFTTDNSSLGSNNILFIAKSAKGSILVYTGKGIYSFQPDVIGYFKKIAGELSAKSIENVKKHYSGINNADFYYPDKLKQLYISDTSKFASAILKNSDTIKGIYKDGKRMLMINSHNHKVYLDSVKK